VLTGPNAGVMCVVPESSSGRGVKFQEPLSGTQLTLVTLAVLGNRLFGESTMDWNRIEGNWKETKGKIKQKWGQLTDDDLAQINGRRDQLEGKIQQRYGLAKDMVRQDVDDWLDAQP
jgi:uncharacterized protein YjbJ (UPF0337 family)